MSGETGIPQGSLGFEDRLWAAADVLRGNLDPGGYKHVVLGLIFLKCLSDEVEERRGGEAPTRGGHGFRVPPEARWSLLHAQSRQPHIGALLHEATRAIEASNPSLEGTLPRVYALPDLDPRMLGELVDLVGDIGLGGREHRGRDTLGRVYEYFLARFASAEGRGGEYYTPPSVVRVLVEILQPWKGRVYDPCCGSGGMFVQSIRFVESHGGRRDAVTLFGQESNATTWRLARMNLALRGLQAHLGSRPADSFHRDLHPHLRADYILANPPFNVASWGGERLEADARWRYGVPPPANANFAWLQHIVHHLAPGGRAGVVLANGSMTSHRSGEGEIRRRLVEAGLVEGVVALPDQLFYTTQIPVCLWILARPGEGSGQGSRIHAPADEVLFVDARGLGRLETRVHRVLDSGDIARIAGVYHAWRGQEGGYRDEPGFCKAAPRAEIAAQDFELTPGRYAGAPQARDDGEPFPAKMARLVAAWRDQQAEARKLDAAIERALEELGEGLGEGQDRGPR